MLLRNSNTGGLEVYDIGNNNISALSYGRGCVELAVTDVQLPRKSM